MRTRLLIATVLMALVAVGCGDDDVVPNVPGDGNIPGNNGDIPSNPFGDGEFSGDAGDCLNLVFAWSEAASLGLSGQGTFAEGADAVEDIAAVVPAEIAADFLIYAQAMRAYGEALDAGGIVLNDPTTYQTPEAQAAASEAFNSPEVEAAGQRITDYLEAQCSGFDE
jgi:hypothetical protein